MFTSIIIPFRRLAPVPLCLTSLDVCGAIGHYPVILIQQGGKQFDFDSPDVKLHYIHVGDEGPFKLGMLLNTAVKAACTKWVTIMDPNLLVPPDFLTFMENAVFAPGHSSVYFPIRHLDSDVTNLIGERFNLFYEGVIPSADQWRLRCEKYKGHTIGTDCFTVLASDYLDIGGYDEYFKDSDLAHLNFACHWLHEFGPPRRAACEVYHRWRHIEFWGSEALDEMKARSLLWNGGKQIFRI